MILSELKIGSYFQFKDDPDGYIYWRVLAGYICLLEIGRFEYARDLPELLKGGDVDREVIICDLNAEASNEGLVVQFVFF